MWEAGHGGLDPFSEAFVFWPEPILYVHVGLGWCFCPFLHIFSGACLKRWYMSKTL